MSDIEEARVAPTRARCDYEAQLAQIKSDRKHKTFEDLVTYPADDFVIENTAREHRTIKPAVTVQHIP